MVNEALDVVVIGGANTDFLVKGRQLPEAGSTVEGDEFQEAAGGKGANQAVAAARLGARTALIGRVGADERGRAILAHLAAEQVDTRAMGRHASEATGAALVMVDQTGRKQILTAPGANRTLTGQDVDEAREHIVGAKTVLLSLEAPTEAIEVGAQLARAAGAYVVLDAAPPRELEEALLRDLHVIRCNAGEAEVLTGVKVVDAPSAAKAAAVLLRRGAGSAIVGAPGGDLLHTAEYERWLPHLPVQAVDETGAGDAFVAALAVQLSRGHTLPSATRFASAAAALATTRLGAQAGLPGHEDVVRLLERFGATPPSKGEPPPSYDRPNLG